MAGLVVITDQIAKALIVAAFGPAAPVHGQIVISGIIDLHYLENRGAAFGLFQSGGWVLGAIAIAVIAVIVIMVPRLNARPEGVPWHLLLALGLVLGGALGNLIDRVRLGYVVDFLTPSFARVTLGDTVYQFPTFNVADSSITVGVLVLLVGFLFTGEAAPPAADSAVTPAAQKEATMTTEAERPVRMARPAGTITAPVTPLGIAGCIALVGGLWAWAVLKSIQGRRRTPGAKRR